MIDDNNTSIISNDNEQKDIINRLKRAEGQIKAIIRLVEDNSDCEIVLQQLKASRTALDAAAKQIMIYITCIARKIIIPAVNIQ